jgi:hypothetical protein
MVSQGGRETYSEAIRYDRALKKILGLRRRRKQQEVGENIGW